MLVSSFFHIFPAIEDPSERLRKTNEKCEQFYAYFLEITTKWLSSVLVLTPALSILRCQIEYGHIDVAHLYHPFTLR